MTANKIADLIRDNRSCRRFYQNHSVTLETLKELVNLGRLSASGAMLKKSTMFPKENWTILSLLNMEPSLLKAGRLESIEAIRL